MPEAPTDAVDGDDKIVTLFFFLSLGGKKRQLGRRKCQPVANQTHMADTHPSGPGQKQCAPGQCEKCKIVGGGRFGCQLAGAAPAVGIVKDGGDTPRGPSTL